MTRYYAKKEERGSRTQVTVTLPKIANDYTRSASRIIKEIELSVVSNSEIIEDIIFTQINSKDIFYQVGKDSYTFKSLLVMDLENHLKQIKYNIINEKSRIARELGDIVNQLRASYLINQRDSMDIDTIEKLDDKLAYHLGSYYDKYYKFKGEKEYQILESDKVISMIDKIKKQYNTEVDKETFVNEALTKIYNNKKYKKIYYEAVLIEEENILEKYENRYIDEEELNDIDKKVRNLLENSISNYYESGLNYIHSISPDIFLELSSIINDLTDEIVAEYIINYGNMPVDLQFRISEILAKKRGDESKINFSDYLKAKRILEQIVKKYNISEMDMLENNILASNSLDYCHENIIEYITREIKVGELEQEFELNIIKNKVKLTEIEEQIKEKKLKLDNIKNELDIYGK